MHKFQLLLEGLCGVTWSHEFERPLVSEAQTFAKQVCIEAPVGCTVALYEFTETKTIQWGEYERAPNVRTANDEFGKPETVTHEKLLISVEEALNNGDSRTNGADNEEHPT